MKIAFLHHSFRLGNGIDSLIYQLAKHINKEHRVTVFTYVSDYQDRDINVEVLPIPFNKNRISNAVLAPLYIKQWGETRRKLEGYDVVISQLYPMSLIPIYPHRLKHPRIVTIEWSVPTGIKAQLYWRTYIRLLTRMGKFACKRSDLVLCPSDFVGKWVEENYGCSYTKLLVDGIDFEVLDKDRATRESKQHPNILYVGRLHLHKNIETLIRAFGLVIKEVPFTTLDLVGDAPVPSYLRQLQRLTRELGVGGSVNFNGIVSWELLPAYYKFCDVYCSPSLWEGFMRCEAFAFEKPMVVFDATSNAETVHNKVDGLVVKEKTPESLAQALLWLIRNEDERVKMGKAGYKWAREKLGFDVIARDLVEIISDIRSTG